MAQLRAVLTAECDCVAMAQDLSSKNYAAAAVGRQQAVDFRAAMERKEQIFKQLEVSALC